MGYEKIYHFILCLIIVLLAEVFIPLWASASLATILALGKEVYLHYHSKQADWTNAAAGIFGALVAVGIIVQYYYGI